MNRTGCALAALVTVGLLATACGDDKKSESSTPATSAPANSASTSSASTSSAGAAATVGEVTASGISAERCAENKKAGKITYLSSFDFSASAAIVDVQVAAKKGYFAKLCLDVEMRPSFSTANYALIEGGKAHFSSAGNYTEMLNYARNGGQFVALVDYGKVPVEGLVAKAGGVTELAQLKGKTIGVKGDLPPSIVAMLKKAGLTRGTDYQEVLLEGFDPVAQLDMPIDALPVYKTNEPGQLDAKGIKYTLFDPATDGIPGSFGIIYTSKDFATKHPTATEDFTRAALRGMEDALADPTEAIQIAVDNIEAAGNQNYLTLQGETYRWTHESAMVKSGTPAGEPVGIIHADQLDSEYTTYLDAGVWPKDPPKDGKFYDADLAKRLYDPSGKVIFPNS